MPRTILITGGARGIGRGIARVFSANGDQVMIADLPDGGKWNTAMWLEHLMPANTADAAGQQQQFEQAMASMIPLGRPQTVEDMGQAALYLANAPNVTGVSLSVAGGFEMN